MSNFIDLHLHSQFSPDSSQSIESYLINYPNHSFITTDHLDFWQESTHQDVVLDYKQLKQQLEIYSKQFNITCYSGIEVGYHKTVEAQTLKYLQNKQFDIIILSLHQDGYQDYLYTDDEYVVDIEDYFDNIIRGLKTVPNITVLGHLDYPFRNNQLPADFFDNPKLIEVINILISKEIALEVNTRSLYQFKNLEFYKKLLELYSKLGGSLLSLGSDAHSLEYHRYHFKEAIQFINEVGSFELINENY